MVTHLTALMLGSASLKIGLAAAVMVATAGDCAPWDSVTAPPPSSASGPAASGEDTSTGDALSAAARKGWTLTDHDEFAGRRIDLRRWGLYDGPGSAGVGLRRPAAISVRNGELRITARGEVSGGMAWRGPPTTYGRWEVRMRADRGIGYSAVLLLWPDSDRWPTDGEVDFAEISAPNRDENNFTVHWGPDNSKDSTTLLGDFSQWHDYAVEWEPDHLTIFVDGRPVYNTIDRAAIPHVPMHLAVQQDVIEDNKTAVGNAGVPVKVTMHIDWVHMYSR